MSRDLTSPLLLATVLLGACASSDAPDFGGAVRGSEPFLVPSHAVPLAAERIGVPSFDGCLSVEYDSAWTGSSSRHALCRSTNGRLSVQCFEESGAIANYGLRDWTEVEHVQSLPDETRCRMVVLGDWGGIREIRLVDLEWPRTEEGPYGPEFVAGETLLHERSIFSPPEGHPLTRASYVSPAPGGNPMTVLVHVDGEHEPSYTLDLAHNVARPLE